MTHPELRRYSPPVMSGWQHQGAFVVRFNAATDTDARIFLGNVEHVASGERRQFSSLEELLKFMAATLTDVKNELRRAGSSHESCSGET